MSRFGIQRLVRIGRGVRRCSGGPCCAVFWFGVRFGGSFGGWVRVRGMGMGFIIHCKGVWGGHKERYVGF